MYTRQLYVQLVEGIVGANQLNVMLGGLDFPIGLHTSLTQSCFWNTNIKLCYESSHIEKGSSWHGIKKMHFFYKHNNEEIIYAYIYGLQHWSQSWEVLRFEKLLDHQHLIPLPPFPNYSLPPVPNLPHRPSPSPHTFNSWHFLPHIMLLSVIFKPSFFLFLICTTVFTFPSVSCWIFFL